MDLLFGPSLDVEIKFSDEDSREIVSTKILNRDTRELAPLFDRDEAVRGTVTLRPRDGRKVDHLGIRVQFVGCIEMIGDKSGLDEFVSVAKDVASPGELRHAETFPFEFRSVDKPYESYNGQRVRLRYFVRVVVQTKLNDVTRERDLWVYNYQEPPADAPLVMLDVGIEDCLHIEFEFANGQLELKDTIMGRIYFRLVRLKLQHMELNLVRREIIGATPNSQTDSEQLVRYEIMDGSPVRGEQIPIRLPLAGFDLVPTMKDVNKKFSVRTFLSLVLVDEAGRRYYKQCEITLYRAPPKPSGESSDLDEKA